MMSLVDFAILFPLVVVVCTSNPAPKAPFPSGLHFPIAPGTTVQHHTQALHLHHATALRRDTVGDLVPLQTEYLSKTPFVEPQLNSVLCLMLFVLEVSESPFGRNWLGCLLNFDHAADLELVERGLRFRRNLEADFPRSYLHLRLRHSPDLWMYCRLRN